jgi:cytochrome bd ubiquinol oxidase subunit I
MDDLVLHRLQFAFTVIYHYLFPQLTMGLALLIVLMKARGLWSGGERWNDAARFWIRIFGINFAVGVVTGIPMEFQFGTNWARFSRHAGSVIGQTLAMEGLFAFFLESSFLFVLVWGERRLSKLGHFFVAVALFAGSWLSGYFVVATNAFMQYPVGYGVAADGTLRLTDFAAFVLSPWAMGQYAHTMVASVVTAAFVMSAVGAYYTLARRHHPYARIFLRLGVAAGLVASLLVTVTGDRQSKMVARHKPVALAAMEGHFESRPRAGLVLIGQPNVAERRLDNPIVIPWALSFLAFGTIHADVRGLDAFPPDVWPDNIELLYYAFHIMVGLGIILTVIALVAVLLLWRDRLDRTRPMLWSLMLAFPLPYIANTVGWMTTELGRQPWLVYGLYRTSQGSSPTVHAGTVLFTLIGFCGLYLVLGILFLFLIAREVAHGPGPLAAAGRTGAEAAHV